ncbi:MAG: CBS domain-containing protein [Haloplanus sp.]
MIDVPVSAVTTERPPTVSPTTPAVEAAARLRRADVSALIVRDSSDAVVGIVTESDIVAVVAEGGENPPVESFMSTPVVTVDSTTPVGLAADRMRDAGVARLPVVDSVARRATNSEEPRSSSERTQSSEETLRGLVSREDIAPYLSRHRLDIDWQGDPLSLDRSGTPDTAATE